MLARLACDALPANLDGVRSQLRSAGCNHPGPNITPALLPSSSLHNEPARSNKVTGVLGFIVFGGLLFEGLSRMFS